MGGLGLFLILSLGSLSFDLTKTLTGLWQLKGFNNFWNLKGEPGHVA
jgi:hypothetical protein